MCRLGAFFHTTATCGTAHSARGYSADNAASVRGVHAIRGSPKLRNRGRTLAN